jgi:hypothetical protein
MPKPTGTLREAVVYQYVYLLAQKLTEDSEQTPYDSGVLKQLRAAVDHVHKWVGSSPANLPPEELLQPRDRREEVVVYASNWQYGTDKPWASYAYARLLDSTLILQLAYGQHQEAHKGTWCYLRSGLWEPLESPLYLGKMICYGGRVPDETAAGQQADIVLPPPHPDRKVPLQVSKLPFGGWLFDRPGLPETLALFYPDDNEHEAQAAGFFNAVLPHLALYAYKLGYQYRQYDNYLRAEVERKEGLLAKAMAKARSPGQDLSRLEEELEQVAGAYGEFASVHGTFEQVYHTVSINVANLEELFVRHGLVQTGPLAAWRAGAVRAKEQLQADGGFYRAIINEAQVFLQVLRTQVEIKRGQLEEEQNRHGIRRNLILAVIGLILALGIGREEGEAFIRWLLGLLNVSLPAKLPEGAIFGARLGLMLLLGVVVAVTSIVWPKLRARWKPKRG